TPNAVAGGMLSPKSLDFRLDELHQRRRGGVIVCPRRKDRARCWNYKLRWRNVRVDSEQVAGVELGLEFPQPRIILAKGRAHLLRQIIRSNMIDVDAALKMRLDPAPEATQPGDMRVRLGSVHPLADSVEIPLWAPG